MCRLGYWSERILFVWKASHLGTRSQKMYEKLCCRGKINRRTHEKASSIHAVQSMVFHIRLSLPAAGVQGDAQGYNNQPRRSIFQNWVRSSNSHTLPWDFILFEMRSSCILVGISVFIIQLTTMLAIRSDRLSSVSCWVASYCMKILSFTICQR
ncbi:uncharacterized protein LAESUDRAFT_543162 [Laetiporus sulphureus 93-53]|uniref:Uncharacterized protein n=1 Tax=Laetiporus sulphureus 93-53 TaxID=1314785 RepID=A0A165FN53_9APHY|nr:uncharacterized protein LAESUDRAFT_543162 [Laetiporus sulphureus 93-53]KZT09218.1 hypothetical protein LAESUDRAFT_543162 [Laetiporus sulphureus 93-53]